MTTIIYIAITIGIMHQSWYQAMAGEKCPHTEDCDQQMAEFLEDLKPYLAKPVKLNITSKPCTACLISNLDSVELNGFSCERPQPNGEKEKDLHVKFDELKAICNCSFPHASKALITATWKNAAASTTVLIEKDESSVVTLSSKVDCKKPNPQCLVPLKDITYKCTVGDNKQADKECHKQEEHILRILEMIVETAFPSRATKFINEHEIMRKKFICEAEFNIER